MMCDVCGISLHASCMKNHPLLKRWIGNLEGVTNTCFECSLYCGVMQQEALPATAKAYYGQIDWRDAGLGPSPLTVGALVASKALELWEEDSNDRCEHCDEGGDLIACSFCNLSFHNAVPCLPEAAVLSPVLCSSEAYDWCCPPCFTQATNKLKNPPSQPPPKRKRGK